MTVLVGILAKDGVVIASDSAVTFGAGNGPTISDKHRKLYTVGDRLSLLAPAKLGSSSESLAFSNVNGTRRSGT